MTIFDHQLFEKIDLKPALILRWKPSLFMSRENSFETLQCFKKSVFDSVLYLREHCFGKFWYILSWIASFIKRLNKQFLKRGFSIWKHLETLSFDIKHFQRCFNLHSSQVFEEKSLNHCKFYELIVFETLPLWNNWIKHCINNDVILMRVWWFNARAQYTFVP